MTPDEMQRLQDAYMEGFEDGQGHGNLPYKYPPLHIAWEMSGTFWNIFGRFDEGKFRQWQELKYNDRQNLVPLKVPSTKEYAKKIWKK